MQEAQRRNGEDGPLAATGEHTPGYVTSIPQPTLWGQIPAALRQRPQWCHTIPDSNPDPRENKSKAPHQANGRLASPTNPAHWSDFETACEAAARCGGGIGYVLTADDPFACIDLDVKDDTTQEQQDRFDKIVSTFDSYTERSRSGKGMHVWVEGGIGDGARRDGVEVYSQERFIICTGNVMADRPIRDKSDLLDILVAEIDRGSAPEVELEEDPDGDQDWYVAEQALDDTGEMGRLFAGDWEGRNYPSQSEADFALMKMLARLSDSNEACRSAFRMSGLGKRDKATVNARYLNRTLTCARTRLANDAVQAAHGKEIADALFWRLTGGAVDASGATRTDTVAGPLTAKPLGAFLREFEKIEFLIDDIYRRGWLYTITGMTGSGKTGIAVSLALCIASGVSVGKHSTAKGVVLYIAGENPDDVRGRFMATLKSGQWGDDVLDQIHVIDQSFLLVERVRELEAIIDSLSPAVVIVDTDQAVSLGGDDDENSNGVRMKHAKNLRCLSRRPSRPTVLT